MKIDQYLSNRDVEIYNSVYTDILRVTPSNPGISSLLGASLLRLQSAMNLLHGHPQKDSSRLKFIPDYQYYILLSSLKMVKISAQNIAYNKKVDDGNKVNYFIENMAPSASSLLAFHLNYKKPKQSLKKLEYLEILVTSNKNYSKRKIGELLREKYSGLIDVFRTPLSKYCLLLNSKPKIRFVDNLTLISKKTIVDEAQFMINFIQN